MTLDELKQTHKLHQLFINDWLFYRAAYKGGQEFIDAVLFQHPRETDGEFLQRRKEAYCFNYPSSIIHLLNFFLTDTPPQRDPGPIAKRKDWKKFITNCDLFGTDMDVFLNDAQKLSAIFGTVGILVDKPGGQYELDDMEVSPYISYYTPDNILDWNFERNLMNNYYELNYVKLRDGRDNYLIWTKDRWEKYYVDEEQDEIIQMRYGENPLGEVPFVFMPNIRGIEYPFLGISDLKDVGRICGEIVRCFSECSQTLKYSAFPMLKMPDEIDGVDLDHANEDDEVVVGKRPVLNFNPEYGIGGQPSWLESPVLDPVRGTKEYADYITEELYRGCLLSSILVNRDKAQQKSGAMLRVEQKQLSALLSKKANNMINAELEIIKLWCKWQSCPELIDQYEINKTRVFSVDELSTELEYSFAAVSQIPSDSFAKAMFKKIANTLLPNIPITDLKTIEDEIEKYSSAEITEEVLEDRANEIMDKPVEIKENSNT
jgi:hypothetical protein